MSDAQGAGKELVLGKQNHQDLLAATAESLSPSAWVRARVNVRLKNLPGPLASTGRTDNHDRFTHWASCSNAESLSIMVSSYPCYVHSRTLVMKLGLRTALLGPVAWKGCSAYAVRQLSPDAEHSFSSTPPKSYLGIGLTGHARWSLDRLDCLEHLSSLNPTTSMKQLSEHACDPVSQAYYEKLTCTRDFCWRLEFAHNLDNSAVNHRCDYFVSTAKQLLPSCRGDHLPELKDELSAPLGYYSCPKLPRCRASATFS
jgi:hypothetical protein